MSPQSFLEVIKNMKQDKRKYLHRLDGKEPVINISKTNKKRLN